MFLQLWPNLFLYCLTLEWCRLPKILIWYSKLHTYININSMKSHIFFKVWIKFQIDSAKNQAKSVCQSNGLGPDFGWVDFIHQWMHHRKWTYNNIVMFVFPWNQFPKKIRQYHDFFHIFKNGNSICIGMKKKPTDMGAKIRTKFKLTHGSH